MKCSYVLRRETSSSQSRERKQTKKKKKKKKKDILRHKQHEANGKKKLEVLQGYVMGNWGLCAQLNLAE